MNSSKKIEVSLIAGLALLAFLFCRICGSRGFFPLDQSIVYDGAWRIIQGQVPFKDFVAPIGPGAFFYQAFVFILFGVNFSSYILGAALLNALSAALAFLLVRRYSPDSLILPCVSGLLSSVWFHSQIGTTYPDQTAMFLCLAALFCALYWKKAPLVDRNEGELVENKSKASSKKERAVKHFKSILETLPKTEGTKFEPADFAAGILWGLAFLTKQNYAVFFLPLLFISVAFAPPTPKTERLHSLWGGVAAIFAIFAAWLLLFSDWRLFIQYFLAIPVNEGLRRLGSIGAESSEIRVNAVILFTNLALALSSFAILYSAVKKGWVERRGDNSPFLATITLFLITYSYLMIKTTNNNPVNAWGFLPLIIGFGFLNVDKTVAESGKILKWALRGTGGVAALSILVFGVLSAWNRNAQDFASPAKFAPLSWPPNAHLLLWCDQTPAGLTDDGRRVVIFKKDVERLTKYLATTNAKFFVFPDFTALYGFLGVPSPQPLLWFHKGLTYPCEYDKKLDEGIVGSLKNNEIDTIVVEEYSWFGTAARLNDFPLLKKFISANFARKGAIGIYSIYRRKGFK